MNARRLLLKIAFPFTKWMGKIGIHRKVNDEKFKRIKHRLLPGDILISSKRYELTNLFIPGRFTHAAFYLGDLAGDDSIIEAIGEGVTISSLPNFCFSKDHIAVLRPKYYRGTEVEHLILVAQTLDGVPYDYFFDHGDEAFYCAELVHYLLSKTAQHYEHFNKRKTLGVETVLPDDFYNARQFFDLIVEV